MITLNQTYVFKMETPTFGNLSPVKITEIFRDGRTCSRFMEEQLPYWFPVLTRVQGNKSHDHIGDDNQKYEAKNFTKNGLRFCPSSHIGAGRNIDLIKARELAEQQTYVLCDIVDFPSVRIRFVPGQKLIESYPSFKIPAKDRGLIFI